MTLRERGRSLLKHNPAALSLAGGVGMAGFVGAFLGYGSGLVDVQGCLLAEVASLAVYVTALVVGYLGNPGARRQWRLVDSPALAFPLQLGATE
jgi:hypothetical protein